MSNIIDIDSRKKRELRTHCTIANSFIQNKNLSPLSIAVGAYIMSTYDCTLDSAVVKKHFNIKDEIMELAFEELVKEGCMTMWSTNLGTIVLTFGGAYYR